MPNVTLSVSPLVKRVFTARYGDGIARITRRDIIYHYLQGDPLVANNHRYRHLQRTLTAEVVVNVSQALSARLRSKKRRIFVGAYLHKVYQDQLLEFVDARVGAGEFAQTAMREWMACYGVEEDDYSLDTAYTSWKRKKRFLQKIKSKEFTEQPKSEPLFLPPCEPSPMLADFRDMVIAANAHFKLGFCNLLKRDLRTKAGFLYRYINTTERSYFYPRKLLCYLLAEYCGMTTREISQLIHISHGMIARNIRHARFEVVQYPEVHHDMEAILAACGTNKAKPVPLLS